MYKTNEKEHAKGPLVRWRKQWASHTLDAYLDPNLKFIEDSGCKLTFIDFPTNKYLSTTLFTNHL
jgi:hypothetical protein